MANKAWRMTEQDKILVGKYILDTIASDGVFPATARAGLEKLLELGIELEGDVSGVLFHENDADGLMHIAIPPREVAKERYQQVSSYEIPNTYVEIANGKSNLTDVEVYQFRIGDYTISHCG